MCPPGYYCQNSGTVTFVNSVCPEGHYCPLGTTFPNQFPCPPGRFNNETFQTSLETGCARLCLEGIYCPAGSTRGMVCPAGYYCPEGTPTSTSFPCPIGTYGALSGLSLAEECVKCPAGYYCPSGNSTHPTVSPLPCRPGTYNSLNGTGHEFNCLSCLAGMACPTIALSEPSHTCNQGHYCPNGTIQPNQYPCPPGTFSFETDLQAPEDCTICLPGTACRWGTGFNFSEPLPCAQGHYCPVGTPATNKFPCPPGTFTDSSNLTSSSECTACPEGHYCIGGESGPHNVCPPGHYCPVGTRFAHEFPCPKTTYNPDSGNSSVSSCLNCTIGNFCEEGFIQPEACPPGTYMPYGYDSSLDEVIGMPIGNKSDCLTCPGGQFCSEGVHEPTDCGVGKYSPPGSEHCFTCLVGHYCDENVSSEANLRANKQCPPGNYCTFGLTSVLDSVLCASGFYCPQGTNKQLACPPGTYNSLMGQSSVVDCVPCDSGYYCLENSTLPSGPCQPGFYCPSNFTNFEFNITIGSYGPTQVACPGATFQDSFVKSSIEDCVECPQGSFCVPGSSLPDVCPLGSYCPNGTEYPIPCPIGTLGNATGLIEEDDCIICPGGQYCDSLGLTSPRGPCDPGYVCYSGANTSTPTDGISGEVCPAGGFCPLGSSMSLPCPPGTFSNTSGSTNTFDCTDCRPGFYCANARTPEPTGPCDAGYYCPGGAKTPNDMITPVGHFTPQGSSAPITCDVGTWMPHEGAGECLPCTPGYYCPGHGNTNLTICPVGFYCTISSDDPQPCPPGTYGNQTSLESLEDCTSCPPGSYCASGGLTEPEGPCSAGFICFGNSSLPNPVESDEVDFGDLCEAGHYCPAGSGAGIPCPAGTYSNGRGLMEPSDCISCSPGMACNTTGLTAPNGICLAGYYCLGGAESKAPTDGTTGDICPKGSFCTAGSSSPQLCPFGTYTNSTGLDECMDCPVGFYCHPLAGVAPVICPAGFYCPQRSSLDYIACPVGTIGPMKGLADEMQCVVCPPGYFCNATGLSTPSGPCTAGYYCSSGAIDPRPQATGENGPCPSGFYCPSMSSTPTPCPVGTYSSSMFNTEELDCVECDSGHFCDSAGLTTVSGLCAAGYYCTNGSTTAFPNTSSDGDICPSGHYCPAGSSQPLPCEPGTYSNTSGSEMCLQCINGFYCTSSTVDPFNFPCPVGHYCPTGTKFSQQNPCRLSTYNPSLNAIDSTACLTCPAGRYCNGTGLDAPSGECMQGSFCSAGSTSPDGVLCEPGNYCPAGAIFEVPCTPGHYCAGFGNFEPTGLCRAGYFCILGASSPTPSVTDGVTGGGECPSGFYCPVGSQNATACPPGTYSAVSGAENVTDSCVVCPERMFCGGYGLSSPSGVCDSGYYCPLGQTVSRPSEFVCPAGYFCPAGSSEPIRCPSGFFQNQTGQDSCLDCPAGYYCDNTETATVYVNDSVCPAGFYCPDSTRFAFEYACPEGTFSNRTGLTDSEICTPCTAGSYCDKEGLTEPSGSCEPGYFCSKGSMVANPPDSICESGFFCPAGSSEPSPCPPGTINPLFRQVSSLACVPCTGGSFCQGYNASLATGLCSSGYYCPANSSAHFSEWILCPVGHYCDVGSVEPTPCPVGRFANKIGLQNSSGCLPCTEGYYCDQTGLSEPVGACSSRYYCPEGSTSPTARPCPVGNYCPPQSPGPLPCEVGTYAPTPLQESCLMCPAGSYCVFQNRTAPCPRGYYCPNGTGLEFVPCPRGTYGAASGLSAVDQCTPCDAGNYCSEEAATLPTGKCNEGYYCAYGVDRPQPLSFSDLSSIGINITLYVNDSSLCNNPDLRGSGGICPVGSFCPAMSSTPTPCHIGTFSDTPNSAVCDNCPAGFYCPVGTSDPTIYPCAFGHYCDEGSTIATENQCPSGTYNNRTGSASIEDCLLCPNGSYCFEPGINQPTGPCDGGYYCTEGSPTPNPSRFSEFGSPCPVGHFCPEGTSTPQSCPPGMYCDRETLSVPSGNCREGYYCLQGAIQPDPIDNITGNICPRGYYCPAGTSFPFECEPGTYSDIEGLGDISDCFLCTAGHYCEGFGLTEPTGVCDAGYYCLSGQSIPTPNNLICTPGHFCSMGTPDQVRCPSGAYQDEYGRNDCKECLSGYYCDSTATPVVSVQNFSCPEGHYCPPGTRFSDEYPCPVGSFNNMTHLVNESQCQACLPGFACTESGLSKPDFPCQAGYFCKSGASSVTPIQGNEANRCPRGHYCEEMTIDPFPCPLGTYNPSLGRQSKSECIPCTGGSFCGQVGIESVQGICNAGYYCDSGAVNSTWIECPPGNYCPVGTTIPFACPIGTYSPFTRLESKSECLPCTAGSFCSEMGAENTTGLCAAGYYCPNGSVSSSPIDFICPVGLHCPVGSAVPISCESGYFTNSTGQSECQVCPERYYCVPVNTSQPDFSLGIFPCPQGYHCPNKTGLDWQPCPRGTFSNTSGLANEEECTPCLGGYYCSDLSQTEVSGICSGGFFCTSGVDTPTPILSELYENQTYFPSSNISMISCPLHRGVGDICPPGHFCPPQTAHPFPCPAGTYNFVAGQDSCIECPAGYYCPDATIDFSLTSCPPGSYCPTGSPFQQSVHPVRLIL